jgi:anti-sigma regulatory factor (Ser/Thr protein kinase)
MTNSSPRELRNHTSPLAPTQTRAAGSAQANLTGRRCRTRRGSLARGRRAWLQQLGYPTDTNDELVVAVNEAVTNAVVHPYPPDQPGTTFALTLWCEQAMAYIAVRDHGRWQSSASTRYGGHGISLMRGLVHTVDIEGDENGTSVTCRHPLPDTSP